MAETEPTQRRRGVSRRILLTVILLVIAVIATVAAFYVNAIRSAPIPMGVPTGEIAFTSNRDGTWDVFIIDPDGHIHNMTTQGAGPTAHDYFPSWSMGSDNQVINFVSSVSGEMGPSQVFPDTLERRDLNIIAAIMMLIGESRYDWDPHWTADGQIVLASLRDFNLEIYAADANGSNVTRLTNNPARDWFPAISLDGTKIAFSSDREGNENIYVMDFNAEPGSEVQLTDNPEDELRPIWSLDGEHILFISEHNGILEDGVLDPFIMDADGANLHQLGADELFEGGGVRSPDGTQLAYVSNQDGDWNIFIRDANGDNVRRLTEDTATDLFPVWRP